MANLDWPATLARVPAAITSAPKAWGRVNAVLGTSALSLFTAATLSVMEQRIAARIVDALIAAAASFDPLLASVGSEHSVAHAQWVADIAATGLLVAAIDGKPSTGTPAELNARLASARSGNVPLGAGGRVLLGAITIAPAEPAADRNFYDAIAAAVVVFA